MSVRYATSGTTSDYAAFAAFAKRKAEEVEANEPGTLAYEWFADEDTGVCFLHEMYEDDDAFLLHFKNFSESGGLDELMSLMDFDSVTSLNRFQSEPVAEILGQFGARTLHGVAGVARG